MRANRVGTRVLVAIALAVALAAPALAVEQAKDGGAAPGGMRVYVDPETGERTSAPPAAAAQLGGAGAIADPAAGLVEEENPEGGYVIHLQRRFRGAMGARTGAAGEVSVECETGATAVSK